jgi:hypothetical protein
MVAYRSNFFVVFRRQHHDVLVLRELADFFLVGGGGVLQAHFICDETGLIKYG